MYFIKLQPGMYIFFYKISIKIKFKKQILYFTMLNNIIFSKYYFQKIKNNSTLNLSLK